MYKNLKLIKAIIVVIFILKLFDSLYIRPHSDAMNYHLYAPLNWAKYGFLHFNLFQAGHYQGAFFEWVLTLVFKLWYPKTVEQKEMIFILIQSLSCGVGYLLIPFFLLKTFLNRLSFQGVVLVLCVYYGCEYLIWAAQFAKNDIWACAAFLAGVFSPVMWVQILGLGLAVGIKATYIFGAVTYLLISFFTDKKNPKYFHLLSVGLFSSLVLLRNYLATGNPVFPQPSAFGIQPSVFRQKYFQSFSEAASWSEVAIKIESFFRYVPGALLLLGLIIFVIIFYGIKKRSWQKEDVALLLMTVLPFPTLFLTGPALEWRTFSGVVYVALFYTVIFLDKFTVLKNTYIYVILVIAFLATSKIDPSSFSRWQKNKDKTFWQMNAKGLTYKRVNQTFENKDILLNYDFSEGFFLNPQMYTVNEHPEYLKIMERYTELNDVRHFIGVHTDGACLGTGLNENFLNKLLEKSSKDLVLDAESENLYHLDIKCERGT